MLLLVSLGVLWLVQYFGELLHLHGTARWFWSAMEIMLAVSALIVVALYLFNDIRRVYRRIARDKGDRP